MSPRSCVVLNNQHRDRLQKLLKQAEGKAQRRFLFQPYTERHLRQVRRLSETVGPVPVYFVVGQYGEEVGAVGLLTRVEYIEDISGERARRLLKDKASGDQGVYSVNLLSVSRLEKIDSVPLGRFKKASDGSPLRPGQWTASVCRIPRGVAVPRSE